MCYFLTVSIPDQTVPQIPEQQKRSIHFYPQVNKSISKHLPENWTSFVVTSGGCSCDLYQAAKALNKDNKNLIKRYRKKGWSETKIERALRSKKESIAHKESIAPSEGLRDDILGLVINLTNTFGKIRLSLHFYSGNIETETFSLIDCGQVSLNDFRQGNSFFKEETTLLIYDLSY